MRETMRTLVLAAMCLSLVYAMAACTGDTGPAGADGSSGQDGQDGMGVAA